MKHLSLQAKLTICILLTSTVLIVLSLYLLNRAWQVYLRADEIFQLNRGANHFILALKDLTFERGRTNVVLSSGMPVSDADRLFIDTRRKAVDDNMAKGIEWLAGVDQPLFTELSASYSRLKSLRTKADEIINSGNKGSAGIKTAEEWFKQATGLIHEIIDTVDTIARRHNLPGNFENYFRYLIYTLEFRDRIGQAGSMMTAAISSGRNLTPVEHRYFDGNLALADYHWSKIEVVASAINDPELNRQKLSVHNKYYELYRPVLEQVIVKSDSGIVPGKMAKKLQELSVPAFDSVFLLRDQITNAIKLGIQKQKKKAFISLVLSSFQFIAGIIIIVFTILYFRNRLFRPLTNLTNALEKIRTEDNVPDLAEEILRPDEIGLLAEGVKMLQLSMFEERNLRKMTEILAITDELTGLYNRHFLEKSIESILTRSDRYNEPVTLALFDLDYFKVVNDTFGHPAGDTVLKQTALIAKKMIRSSDMLIRFGGDEFILLMPHTSLNGGAAVADKMRESIGKNAHEGIGCVTASFGVAERKVNESFENWYARTDEALYLAKQAGRNAVIPAGYG